MMSEKDYLIKPQKSEQPPPLRNPDFPNMPGDSVVTATLPSEKQIKRKDLINRLNYLNFQDRPVLLHFEHPTHGQLITLPAVPQPCANQYLVCLWSKPDRFNAITTAYRYHSLTLLNGQHLITVAGEIRRITPKGICLKLPQAAVETKTRTVERMPGQGLQTQLVQNSIFFHGSLLDFSSDAFRVALQATPPQTHQWINPKSKVNIIFTNSDESIYSGECRIIDQRIRPTGREYILKPLNKIAQRFQPKEYRSHRVPLDPAPDMLFSHPLTQKRITLRVWDMSGSGFSVQDSDYRPCLIAGMILPEVELRFADNLKISCRVQVVYRKRISDEKNSRIRCGLTFLDISLPDHRRLISLLHRTQNKNAYVSNKVDMDELWGFFFKTGFIYPGKYHFISENKQQIKETYKKLYTRNPGIATHFIYQENGSIQGHMSMVRFYSRTWLIHHHAALRTSMKRAGLIVLDQVGKFISDGCRLHANHMDHVICYFRPENKFPNHIFGGAARLIQDPKICSVDTFSYSHVRKPSTPPQDLPEPWKLTKPTVADLIELGSVYERLSGGLMTTALDLAPDTPDRQNIAEEFAQAGFRRERRLFALKHGNHLSAIIMVNNTDIALNMSDLTNCVKVIILDPDILSKEILLHSTAMVSKYFDQKKFPMLIYPDFYAEKTGIPLKKRYNLWILNPHFSDNYFGSLEKLMKGSG